MGKISLLLFLLPFGADAEKSVCVQFFLRSKWSFAVSKVLSPAAKVHSVWKTDGQTNGQTDRRQLFTAWLSRVRSFDSRSSDSIALYNNLPYIIKAQHTKWWWWFDHLGNKIPFYGSLFLDHHHVPPPLKSAARSNLSTIFLFALLFSGQRNIFMHFIIVRVLDDEV